MRSPTLLSPFAIDSVQDILHTVREHLGMDVAFISEFADGARVFRYVDTAFADHPVKAGGGDPMEESYCQRILDGRLPGLIKDASNYPAATELPATAALPVGAHLSVPIRLSNGRVFGTFCCFSHAPDQTLTERDMSVMQAFADLAGRRIEKDVNEQEERLDVERRIKSVIDGDRLSTVYQPIFHLAQNRIVGYEALTRFTTTPVRAPDLWFKEAVKVGLGPMLESHAIRKALKGLTQLPDDVYVSINASPETILSGAVESECSGMPLERIVLEVTEHALIDRYEDIADAVCHLRNNGMRMAVDDAGAGYASFRHILNLAPDIIKLDMSLTRDIDRDRSRRALAAALTGFAEQTGSKIVAEGVETQAELQTLRQLGVNKAQGYLLGRPLPLAEALKRFTPGASAQSPGDLPRYQHP